MQAPFISFSGIYCSGELSCLPQQLNEPVCSLKRELAVILASFPGKCSMWSGFPTLFTTKNECALHMCTYSKCDCAFNECIQRWPRLACLQLLKKRKYFLLINIYKLIRNFNTYFLAQESYDLHHCSAFSLCEQLFYPACS